MWTLCPTKVRAEGAGGLGEGRYGGAPRIPPEKEGSGRGAWGAGRRAQGTGRGSAEDRPSSDSSAFLFISEFKYCWKKFVYSQRRPFRPWKKLDRNYQRLVEELEDILG